MLGIFLVVSTDYMGYLPLLEELNRLLRSSLLRVLPAIVRRRDAKLRSEFKPLVMRSLAWYLY